MLNYKKNSHSDINGNIKAKLSSLENNEIYWAVLTSGDDYHHIGDKIKIKQEDIEVILKHGIELEYSPIDNNIQDVSDEELLTLLGNNLLSSDNYAKIMAEKYAKSMSEKYLHIFNNNIPFFNNIPCTKMYKCDVIKEETSTTIYKLCL